VGLRDSAGSHIRPNPTLGTDNQDPAVMVWNDQMTPLESRPALEGRIVGHPYLGSKIGSEM